MYATIYSIKKMREIIHFETFMDWCAILYIIISMVTNPNRLSADFGNSFCFFLNRKVTHFANAYSILKCII